MKINFDNDWSSCLSEEINKEYFKELINFVNREQKSETIYPLNKNIFHAFKLTKIKDVKVVILGQDPYHGKEQGHGLAFSVQDGVKIPPSLRNIFTEYSSDLGFETPKKGDLTSWAEEGVFLLNAVLTVREAQANSHKGKGWEIFTDSVIKKISDENENVIFILWGKPAQLKSKIIDETKHLVLKAPHPSPLSSYRGFFESKPFSKVNDYLKLNKIKEIDWKLN